MSSTSRMAFSIGPESIRRLFEGACGDDVETRKSRLRHLSARLGTSAEEPGDFDESVAIAHWLSNQLQPMLLAQALGASSLG